MKHRFCILILIAIFTLNAQNAGAKGSRYYSHDSEETDDSGDDDSSSYSAPSRYQERQQNRINDRVSRHLESRSERMARPGSRY
jgi:hypothetical protein